LKLYRTVAVGRMEFSAASAGGSLIYDVIMLSAHCGGGRDGIQVSSDEAVKYSGQLA